MFAKKLILSTVMLLGMSNVVSGATYETVDNVRKIDTTFVSGVQSRLYGAKTEYDLRNYITLKVKDQDKTSFCWSISTTTVLETYKALVDNKQVEYSPRHMEYATSKTFKDGTNSYAYNREINSGGNVLLGYGYITSGRGPVSESQMPFITSTDKINLKDLEGKVIDVQLDEYVVFPNIYKSKIGAKTVYTNGQTGEIQTDAQIEIFRNQIKEHIMKYGGVTAQINATRHEFFSNQTEPKKSSCYYCDDSSIVPNHQVTIIGWDDNYAISNFNEEHRPTKPGAYLVQNSFGTDDFINGYMYISYDDFLVETAMTGITKMSDIDYDNIYQYDPLGCNDYLTTNSNEITGANVFKKSSEQEWLNEVSFYTVSGCTYEIYVNTKNGDLTKLEKVATIGNKDTVYYTTYTLEEPLLLTGNEFAVAIKYISQNTASIPIECVSGYDETDVFATAKSNEEESYICAEGSLQNWVDMEELNVYGVREINLCLKAFTTETDETIVQLSSEKYNISDKITKISPNTTIDEFKKNINTNATVKIYDGIKELASNDVIGTNCIVRLLENEQEYKLVVTGDINGDGKVTGTDLFKLKKHIVKLENLENEYLNAADINYSNSITSTDLIKMKQLIIGMLKI